MKVDELKMYLRLHGLTVTGEKAECLFPLKRMCNPLKLLRKLKKTFEISTRESYYMVKYFFLIQFIYCLVGLVKKKAFSSHL